MPVIAATILLFALRLLLLGRVWGLPLKNGEEFFLAQRVEPGFYREAGARLLRRYRTSILVPLLLDAPLVAWLAATRRNVALGLEQVFALVLTAVVYNIMAVHFSYRASAIAGDREERPTTLQLSMAPRRLRDHTNFAVEAMIVVAFACSLALLAHNYALSLAPGASHAAIRAFRGGMVLTVWVVYWQIGFLLLKGVFVRWRMPLPANRTEDFRRWRAAWLTHNLRVFDAMRLLCAIMQLGVLAFIPYSWKWPRPAQAIELTAAILVMAAYMVYVLREGRHLSAMARELKPIELVKEFPRSPIAQGRYLAGGLLYFNRDNPKAIVRGIQGIAINMAHPSVYAWTGYFLGLAVLIMWILRGTH